MTEGRAIKSPVLHLVTVHSSLVTVMPSIARLEPHEPFFFDGLDCIDAASLAVGREHHPVNHASTHCVGTNRHQEIPVNLAFTHLIPPWVLGWIRADFFRLVKILVYDFHVLLGEATSRIRFDFFPNVLLGHP